MPAQDIPTSQFMASAKSVTLGRQIPMTPLMTARGFSLGVDFGGTHMYSDAPITIIIETSLSTLGAASAAPSEGQIFPRGKQPTG